MTDLQKIRERLHKEMEVLVDRTLDQLAEEAAPPTRVPLGFLATARYRTPRRRARSASRT